VLFAATGFDKRLQHSVRKNRRFSIGISPSLIRFFGGFFQFKPTSHPFGLWGYPIEYLNGH
jgi:hypothetical protein